MTIKEIKKLAIIKIHNTIIKTVENYE